MIIDSDITTKLSPLCPLLNLDRDDFYVKRAIHLYTRSTLTSISSSNLSTTSNLENTNTNVNNNLNSPQLENLLKDIDDIASCTKKPLSRVKIWRLVYEMEKDRNTNIAEKALITALNVFDQLSKIEHISDEENTTYSEIKYETILEMVKHKSKETIIKMMEYKNNIISQYKNIIWKQIHQTEQMSLINKLSPYFGDISKLLKTFFEIIIDDVWIMQLNFLRNITPILSVNDLLDQKQIPIVSDYLQYVGKVAIKIYQYHLMLENCNVEKNKKDEQPSSSSSTLTSSILQSIRHGIIGKLLADVDNSVSDNNSRAIKSNSQTFTQQQSGISNSHSLMSGLWDTSTSATSNADSSISPSLAEMRRREDIYRAFGIAALLSTCTSSCPR